MVRRALVSGVALLAHATCLEPTEITLTVTSDICDLREVSVYVEDATAPSATKTLTMDPSCDPKKSRSVGTLVFSREARVASTSRWRGRSRAAFARGRRADA